MLYPCFRSFLVLSITMSIVEACLFRNSIKEIRFSSGVSDIRVSIEGLLRGSWRSWKGRVRVAKHYNPIFRSRGRSPDPGGSMISPGPQLHRSCPRSWAKWSTERFYGGGDGFYRQEWVLRWGDRSGEVWLQTYILVLVFDVTLHVHLFFNRRLSKLLQYF